MTWRGCDPAIEIRSLDELRNYIRSLDYSSWRPSNFVVHNTASPTLYQWWHSVPPAERMVNLRNYYEQDMGWSAGPHAFIDGVSWWIFTPFNVKGVHSPSWNGSMLGFEHVGDYDHESDETGMGADVMRMGHELSAACCDFFGWNPEALKFHKEDPQTSHDCPGSNMVKSEYINDVQQVMGDGGEDHDKPILPHRGVVSGVAEGDKLNIRASSSSSAPVIGTADNGDEVMVVGEAYNGSTRWLRLQFGNAAGTGVAIFGWASASYITEGEAIAPPPQQQTELHTSITATVWNDSTQAYAPYGPVTGKCVALPTNVADQAQRQRGVRLYNRVNGKSAQGPVTDKGPWVLNDDFYVFGRGDERPIAETCYDEGAPLPAGSGPHAGNVPANPAGIDLSPDMAAALGISGKGVVDWEWA